MKNNTKNMILLFLQEVGAATIEEIADEYGINRKHVGMGLEELVSDGLVERHRNPDNSLIPLFRPAPGAKPYPWEGYFAFCRWLLRQDGEFDTKSVVAAFGVGRSCGAKWLLRARKEGLIVASRTTKVGGIHYTRRAAPLEAA